MDIIIQLTEETTITDAQMLERLLQDMLQHGPWQKQINHIELNY